MAVQNGVASSMLLFPAAGSAGAQLRLGTASRWRLIRAEVQRRYGWTPEITSSVDGFRPLAVQERIFRDRYTIIPLAGRPTRIWNRQTYWLRPGMSPAAVPGTSNHGIGKTVDVVNVGGLNNFKATRFLQFADVATEFGFSNAEGHSIGEPWHWSDTKNPDAPDGPDPIDAPTEPVTEDDMPLTQADLEAIDRLIVDRLNQRLAQPLLTTQGDKETVDGLVSGRLNQRFGTEVLTQTDKETIDRLIIDRVAQALAGLTAGSVETAAVAKATADELAKRLTS